MTGRVVIHLPSPKINRRDSQFDKEYKKIVLKEIYDAFTTDFKIKTNAPGPI
jgi:hypothetical protein